MFYIKRKDTMKKFIIYNFLCITLFQYISSSDQPRYIYVTHKGKEIGPFYRQKDADNNDTNIFLAGTNNAVGFSQTETNSIIKVP